MEEVEMKIEEESTNNNFSETLAMYDGIEMYIDNIPENERTLKGLHKFMDSLVMPDNLFKGHDYYIQVLTQEGYEVYSLDVKENKDDHCKIAYLIDNNFMNLIYEAKASPLSLKEWSKLHNKKVSKKAIKSGEFNFMRNGYVSSLYNGKYLGPTDDCAQRFELFESFPYLRRYTQDYENVGEVVFSKIPSNPEEYLLVLNSDHKYQKGLNTMSTAQITKKEYHAILRRLLRSDVTYYTTETIFVFSNGETRNVFYSKDWKQALISYLETYVVENQ